MRKHLEAEYSHLNYKDREFFLIDKLISVEEKIGRTRSDAHHELHLASFYKHKSSPPDFSIRGHRSEKVGNLWYRHINMRNFSP